MTCFTDWPQASCVFQKFAGASSKSRCRWGYAGMPGILRCWMCRRCSLPVNFSFRPFSCFHGEGRFRVQQKTVGHLSLFRVFASRAKRHGISIGFRRRRTGMGLVNLISRWVSPRCLRIQQDADPMRRRTTFQRNFYNHGHGNR